MTYRAAARAWLAEDPDPATRAVLATALADGDDARLKEWFGARLEFGTAGMRGALGPGPNRMNRALVRRVTAGLAAAIAGTEGPVVVGFDGRRGSREFAEDAVAVLLGAGRTVLRYDDVVPTPELAHAVLALGCAAGVMITASHNPPEDNGYKVYASNGAQIVPPLDGAIAAAIEAVGPLADVPLGDVEDADPVPREIRQRYVEAVLALRVHPEGSPIPTVYTAMHGVGSELLGVVFAAAGRERIPVPEQALPDPAFPTVKFPNPEEPGALDRALAVARARGAKLVIANDPDADRLAVAVPDGAGWRQLTGNQVGCLLAEDLLAHGPRLGDRLVATTIVSSRMLARIAADHGAGYAETLTGFKWIANAAIPFDGAGGRFVLGYEEALGYSAGGVVRDKDGISAALLLVDLASWLATQGRTLLDAWADLCRRHGLHQAGQRSLAFGGLEGKAKMGEITARLRSDPPREIAGVGVARLRDLDAGVARDLATGVETRVDLPRSDVLGFDLQDGSSVLVRPSGTEPKVKLYFEVREPMGGDDALGAVEARAAARIERLAADLLARIHAGA